MVAEGHGNLPVPDLRTIEELCQQSLNGRGGPIALIPIQEMNFRLKNDMIQQSIKVNGVTDDALSLYLFPLSLTHHATAWFDRLPKNSINTFEQMDKMFLRKYFLPSMVTKLKNEIMNFCQRPDESLFEAWERYKLSIDRCPNHNMLPVSQIDTFYNGLTLRHRDTINVDTYAQQSESSSSITSSSDTKITALKAEMAEINKNHMRVLQVNQQVKEVTPNCETCGGPHSFNDCPTTIGNTQNVYAAGAYQGNSYQPQGNHNLLSYRSDNYLGPLGFNQNQNRNNQNQNIQNQNRNQGNHNPQGNNQGRNQFFQGANQGNTITNPKEDLKGITTRSGTAYQGPTIPTTTSSSPVVERETEATKDMMHPTNNGSTKDVQPLVVPTESPILNCEPVISPIIKPVASSVSAPKPNLKPSIPYSSRLHDQKLRDKTNDQREKIFQIFKDLNFNISFADALILIPNPGRSQYKHKSNAIVCVDKLSLLDLYPMCMTLELSDRSISHPVGVAEDVFVKVGTFHFPTDFVVVDFDADPRVPLILRRTFIKTRKDLIDVFEGNDKLPVIIAKDLNVEKKTALITVLKSHKRAIAWKLSDIKGIDTKFCAHKILMEEDFEPAIQHQRRVNLKIHDVIKEEVLKLLDVGLIYPISDSPWISPVHCVPKKGGFTVVENEENELILTRLVMGWHVRIDYRKLNEATRKDHFPLPFMDQMLERLAGNQYYCFLDSFSGYFQIPIDLKDQEKTTFTCPFKTFAYR
uniref:Reverse transcriptase domain-containing protein n=1 Tax=Tanacetum cinerariifolium TaxID=118510 RepID=A0A6L2MW31_TANCI|nr:reverse transcriptase domain-containing protein [Tanacetum cinerariifolium]